MLYSPKNCFKRTTLDSLRATLILPLCLLGAWFHPAYAESMNEMRAISSNQLGIFRARPGEGQLNFEFEYQEIPENTKAFVLHSYSLSGKLLYSVLCTTSDEQSSFPTCPPAPGVLEGNIQPADIVDESDTLDEQSKLAVLIESVQRKLVYISIVPL